MNSSLKAVAAVVVGSCLVTVVACGSSTPDANGFDSNLNASGGTPGTSGMPGSSGDFGSSGMASGGTSGASGGPACAAQEAAASLTKRPVDIVFVIDNSGSMSGEITETQNQVNTNFAALIEASKIDYRVIMVTRHGQNSAQSVCISQPLSGTTCMPVPAQPVETAKFFQHSIEIASTDAWCRMLTSFDTADEFNLHPTGWGSLLRPTSFKVFVTISDDHISSSCNVRGANKTFNDGNNAAAATTAADAFDAELLALSPAQFGTAAKRNYLVHAIAGFDWFDLADKTKAYPPTAPIATTKCGIDSVNPGYGHQALAIKTGGLRFPSCQPNYTTIFKAMAAGIIDGAKVACEFPVPADPAGQTLDLSTVVPHYTPGAGGAGTDFGQVANVAACAANKFYIEANTIKLCPATCDTVQADPKAAIKVLFGCAPKGAN